MILLYNKIRSRGNAELDLLLDEGDVDAILTGKQTQYPPSVVRLVEQLAQEFVNDLFSTLRERMLDLRYCTVVFVGGGAILLRRQIEASGKVGKPLFVSNINANAADMSICTALKLRAGDSYGGQERTGAFFPAVQYQRPDPFGNGRTAGKTA